MAEKKSKFIAKRVTEKEDHMLTSICQIAGEDKGEIISLGIVSLYALAKAIGDSTQGAEERRRVFAEVLSARDDAAIVRLETEAALASVRRRMEVARRFQGAVAT